MPRQGCGVSGISWYKFAERGIIFPFQNKDYGKTTNEERKTTDFTAIVKIVEVIVTK